MYNVTIQPRYDSAGKAIEVQLYDQTHLYPIHYSLDGTPPKSSGPQYSRPLLIAASADLRTAVFKNDQLMGTANADLFTIHRALGAVIFVSPDSTTEKTGCWTASKGQLNPMMAAGCFFTIRLSRLPSIWGRRRQFMPASWE